MTNLAHRQHERLAPHTTLFVGGVADYVVEVTTVDALKEALQFARTKTAILPLILGGGSNVLINDDGYRGLVIINRIGGIQIESPEHNTHVRVGAGVMLDTVVEALVAQGYWGLENLSGIPGTVGATPIQNVGAYGVEVSDRIESVTAVHRDTARQRTFTAAECQFGYRDSYFKTVAGKEWVITEVVFRVTKEVQPVVSYRDLAPLTSAPLLTPQLVRDTVIAIRNNKFPDWRAVGTAGSFFKNPTIDALHHARLIAMYKDMPSYPQPDGRFKVSLGWILDHVCNLKGFSIGGVRLYEAQALVLVAERGVTATDIDSFARQVSDTIFSHTDIHVEREVQSI